MPGPYHQWLYLTSGGATLEILNASRTSAYLSNAALAPRGFDVCNALGDAGCETYPYEPYLGTDLPGWVDFSGATGNDLSAPDAAALDIVGDLTLVAHIIPDDWTPSAQQTIIGKWGAAGQRSYELCLATTGALIFQWSVAGTTIASATSTANLSTMTVGDDLWVAADIDVSVGGNKTVRFWTSSTGLVWTQLGTSVTTAGTTSIHSGTAVLSIGASNAGTAENFTGRIAEAQVRTGIGTTQPGGTIVFQIDGSEYDENGLTSFTAASGQTVTVTSSGALQIIVRQYCDDWMPLSFATPATDPAPWYNSNYPESADALGFYVEEWTGLGSDHVRGALTATGRPGGGGRVGVLGSQGRVMKLNLFAVANSEAGMQYLMDWLSSQLIGMCGGCGDDTMLFRRFCGSESDLWNGVGEMRRVRVIEGVSWEAEPVEIATCFLRRMSFTIAAGDPCVYFHATDVPADPADFTADLSTCLADGFVDEDRHPCRPSCSELTEDCRAAFTFEVNPLGAMAPVVQMYNDSAEPTLPMRVLLYADPLDVGVDPNPCGLPLMAEIYIRSMPAYASFIWDIAGRTTYFRDVTTGEFVEGGPYIDANDPPVPRYSSLPCGKAWLVFEPGTFCLTGSGPWTDPVSGLEFTTPTFPTTTVRMQERVGCA